MIRDRIVVFLGDFMHKDHEFLDFVGLCVIFILIAAGCTL